MRAPHRKRPRKDDQLVPGPETDLAGMSGEVSYVISTEHKDYLTSAGPGNLRSDASACPRGLDFGEVEEWLRRPSTIARSVPCLTATTRAMCGSASVPRSTRLALATRDWDSTRVTRSRTMKPQAGYDDRLV